MLQAIHENVKNDFNRRILDERLDYARFLLTQTSVPLKKIAARCGWKNESAFTTIFRRRVGVTPLRYRRWHQC